MIKKLILVGCTIQDNKAVNGQSMMFQLFVNKLKEKNIKTVILDFGKSLDSASSDKRISGKFSVMKFIDNFLLTFEFLFALLTNFGTPVYITTSQSKVGFVRDYIFINIAKFFRRKLITHQFGSNYDKFFQTQTFSVQKKIINTLQKADRIIVEGDYTKNHFKFLKNYQEKVISIPNGLPENIDSKNIHGKKIDPQKSVKIIYLSNLIESKGYWDVLNAFNILVNRDNRNIEAIFSGKLLGSVDDQMFKSVESAQKEFFKFIEKNNLSRRIRYFNGLFGEEKAKAFHESQFFILPSYYINEGQPVSILEALAYGCVPIVTKYRLIPDMVNDENGFFVNPKSPEEIVDVINNMIENPLEYSKLSEAGINCYLKNFTADKYVENVLNLF